MTPEIARVVMASIHISVTAAILISIAGVFIAAPASAEDGAPHLLIALLPANANAAAKNAGVLPLPPLLASAKSPLSSAAAAITAARIKSGLGLASDLARFCACAGFLCNQTIPHSSPFQVYALTDYGPPAALNDPHNKLMKTVHAVKGLFFAQSELALGSTLRLPNPLEPLALRAFLPPPLHKALAPLFSLGNVPRMLHLFGFSSDSTMAINVEETLELCQSAPGRLEVKACVSSWEQMVSFAASLLGTSDLEVLVGANYSNRPASIDANVDDAIEVETSMSGVVACHNVMFPYQVFYCHYLEGSKVFKVILRTQSNDPLQGNLVHALATCHDLIGNLGPVLPERESPPQLICHWNFGDNIVWIPRQQTLT